MLLHVQRKGDSGSPRVGVDDEVFQGVHQTRIRHGDRLPAPAGATHAARGQDGPRCDLADPLPDRFPREPTGPLHHADAAVPQGHGFTRRHHAPRPFVQQRPHGPKFCRQFRKTRHAQAT